MFLLLFIKWTCFIHSCAYAYIHNKNNSRATLGGCLRNSRCCPSHEHGPPKWKEMHKATNSFARFSVKNSCAGNLSALTIRALGWVGIQPRGPEVNKHSNANRLTPVQPSVSCIFFSFPPETKHWSFTDHKKKKKKANFQPCCFQISQSLVLI